MKIFKGVRMPKKVENELSTLCACLVVDDSYLAEQSKLVCV